MPTKDLFKITAAMLAGICLCGLVGCGGADVDSAHVSKASQAEEPPKPKTAREKILGSWGVGADFDQQMYNQKMDEASDADVESLNAAIDSYSDVSLQIEFKDDGTYTATMEMSGQRRPIEGNWSIGVDTNDEATMKISSGSPAQPMETEVHVSFADDNRFRTEMFGIPQEVEGMFYYSYTRNTP